MNNQNISANEKNLLIIGNDGENIAKSNYWGSEIERAGKFFLSLNSGAYRLLWPRCRKGYIREMKTAKEVVISLTPQSTEAGGMVEILFDDHTPSPFVLYTSTLGVDRLATPAGILQLKFSLWSADFAGKPVCKFRRPCFIRVVSGLPCLQPVKQD